MLDSGFSLFISFVSDFEILYNFNYNSFTLPLPNKYKTLCLIPAPQKVNCYSFKIRLQVSLNVIP